MCRKGSFTPKATAWLSGLVEVTTFVHLRLQPALRCDPPLGCDCSGTHRPSCTWPFVSDASTSFQTNGAPFCSLIETFLRPPTRMFSPSILLKTQSQSGEARQAGSCWAECREGGEPQEEAVMLLSIFKAFLGVPEILASCEVWLQMKQQDL